MNRWQLRHAWDLIRDIAFTGTGLVIIWRQVLFAALHPSWPLLVTGLTLTSPSIAAHVKALLPDYGGESESSAPSQPPLRPPPSTSSPG